MADLRDAQTEAMAAEGVAGAVTETTLATRPAAKAGAVLDPTLSRTTGKKRFIFGPGPDGEYAPPRTIWLASMTADDWEAVDQATEMLKTVKTTLKERCEADRTGRTKSEEMLAGWYGRSAHDRIADIADGLSDSEKGDGYYEHYTDVYSRAVQLVREYTASFEEYKKEEAEQKRHEELKAKRFAKELDEMVATRKKTMPRERTLYASDEAYRTYLLGLLPERRTKAFNAKRLKATGAEMFAETFRRIAAEQHDVAEADDPISDDV